MDKFDERYLNFFRIGFEKNCKKIEEFADFDAEFLKVFVMKKYRCDDQASKKC